MSHRRDVQVLAGLRAQLDTELKSAAKEDWGRDADATLKLYETYRAVDAAYRAVDTAYIRELEKTAAKHRSLIHFLAVALVVTIVTSLMVTFWSRTALAVLLAICTVGSGLWALFAGIAWLLRTEDPESARAWDDEPNL